MTNSTQFASSADKWATELWNVSLLPVPRPDNDAGTGLRRLENVDEKRSARSLSHPLMIERAAVSDILR
jgi:hypothetical protein